ncbi:MAG: hypothetical protein E7371_03165 [Clostridiales bacterium]|nr:hypothetical protein [Clostridiales bacterium]
MKLFFKHLAKSIAKKPLQPIILVLTLTLAIAVSIFSFSMRAALDEEIVNGQAAKYGNAQISIGLSGDAASRFMFAEDVENLLGDDCTAVGTFELPVTVGKEQKTFFGVAVDFREIGGIFDFTFIEYGEVTPSTVGYSAFVTQAFASENDLKLGDDFTVRVFGAEKSYKVSGISRKAFLGEYSMMVDITGVIRLITDDSPLLSALGDGFKPSSTIFVRVNGADAVENMIHTLQADERFADKTIEDVSRAMYRQSNVNSLGRIIDVSAVLAALLSASVTFCCFYIIGSERTEENYAFTLSGAKPWMLNGLQYAEIILYWIVSTVLGCLLTAPMTKLLFALAGFRYASAAVRPLQMAFGAGLLLFVSLATVTMFIGVQKTKRKNKPETHAENRAVFFTVLCALALTVSSFITPMDIRFELYIVLALSLCFCAFVVTPVLIKWLATKWNASFEQRFSKEYRLRKTALRYAVKNIFSVKILHNISRLVAVLSAIVLTACLLVVSAFGNVKSTKAFFNGDYLLMNATESCQDKVTQCVSVENSVRVYFSDHSGTRIVSAESLEGLSQEIAITQLPQGNQAVIGSGEAKMRSLKVGDNFTRTIDGRRLDFVIIEVVSSAVPFVLFDCEYFGIPYNIMVVQGAENVSKGALLQELTDKTALELAVVLTVEDLFEEKFATTRICLNLGLIFLLIVAFFACVGIVDNLYESYRARKEEFNLYVYSGMSGKEIRQMKIWEVLLTFGGGLALGIVGFALLSLGANACFYTFGFETFLNVWAFLR